MTVVVEFGKSQYHLQSQLMAWCEANVGPGRWAFEQAPKDWDNYKTHGGEFALWTISSAYGNTFFAFKNEKDATLFSLKWK